MVQFGCAQVEYIAARTRRWARLARRCSVRRWMVSSASTMTVVMAASQQYRCMVATGTGTPSTVSHIVSACRPSQRVRASVWITISATPIAPASALTAASRAWTFNWSNGILALAGSWRSSASLVSMTLWSCSSRKGSSEIRVIFIPDTVSVHRLTDDAARCRSASSTSFPGRVRDLMSAINAFNLRSKFQAEEAASASNRSDAASTSSRSSSDNPLVSRARTSTCSADTSPSARASSNPGTVAQARSRSSAALASRAEPLPSRRVSNPPADSPEHLSWLARRAIRMSMYAVYAFNVAFCEVTVARASRSAVSIDEETRRGECVEDSLLVHRAPPRLVGSVGCIVAGRNIRANSSSIEFRSRRSASESTERHSLDTSPTGGRSTTTSWGRGGQAAVARVFSVGASRLSVFDPWVCRTR